MKINAAVYESGNRTLTIDELELAPPQAGEVLVRLAASGVCHSDYHVIKGEWTVETPIVLGHEGAGVVEAVGEGVSNVSEGDHVILSWVPYCGHCAYCLAGRPVLCSSAPQTGFVGVMPDGTTRLSRDGQPVYSYCGTGTFGGRTVVAASAAIPIRRDAPLDRAALVGCAVTTGVGAVINTAGVRPGDTVLVIGCGGVGLSVVMGAGIAAAGAIIATDLSDSALELARRVGATETINTREEDLLPRLRGLVGQDGVDWAFEAIGSGATVEAASQAIRPGGTAVIVGQAPEGVRAEIDPLEFSDREKRLIGSSYGSCRPARDFPLMIDLYMQGRLDIDALMARTCALSEINDAFAALGSEPGRTVISY
jgi:S-(hydroxymethyl)glutathione dehydrogenase/alcohol dehydrogenase